MNEYVEITINIRIIQMKKKKDNLVSIETSSVSNDI